MGHLYKISQSNAAFPKNIAFFGIPATDVATAKSEIVEFTNKNPPDDRRILFLLEGIRNQLINLKDTKIYIRGQIVYEDGTKVPSLPSTDWSPDAITSGDDKVEKEKERVEAMNKLKASDVFPVNNLLYSLFKDGTFTLQNTKMYQNDIAYKSIFDAFTNNKFTPDTEIMTQFFSPPERKSKPGESIIATHSKTSLDGLLFFSYTEGSNEIEMCGNLPFDICQQEKLLLTHVDVKIELLKHDPDFFLRHPHNLKKYKFVTTDVRLMVPLVTLPPEIEIGQAEVLKNNPALYSFIDKKITAHSVSSGGFFFEHVNTWNGNVPTKLTILMIPSENYNGSLNTDPFGFQHNYVNDITISVDNIPVGGKGMKLMITNDEKTSQIMDAYCSIVDNFPKMEISREDWLEKFPAFHFNINTSNNKEVLPLVRKGMTKVLINFDQPLTTNTIILMLAEFPGLLEIDGRRNITL